MAEKIVQKLMTQVLLRNDTANNWSTVNPTLSKGEIGIEINTGLFKIGTGLDAWNSLPYAYEKLPLDSKYFEFNGSKELTLNVNGTFEDGALLQIVDGELAWVKPDNSTVEGLSANVKTLIDELYDVTDGKVPADGVSRIDELDTAVATNAQGIADNAVAIEGINNKIAEIEGDYADVVASISETKAELEGKIALKADQSAFEGHVSTYNEHLTAQAEIDAEQDRRLTEVEGLAESNTNRVVALETTVNGAEGEEGLVARVVALETAIGEGAEIDSRLDAAEADIDALEAKVGHDVEGETPATGLFLEVDQAKAAADEADRKAQAAQNAADSAQADVDAVTEEVYGKDAEGELNAKSRITVLEERVTDLEVFEHDTYATKDELKEVSDKVDVLVGTGTGSVAEALGAAQAAQNTADANAEAIEKLNGGVEEEGSVAKAIKDSQDAQNTTIAATYATKEELAAEAKARGDKDTELAGLIADNAANIEANANDIADIKTEIQNLASSGLKRQIVEVEGKYGLEALQALDGKAENVVYLVKESATASDYAEYMYVNGSFEKIGATAATWDGYVTEEELATELTNYDTRTVAEGKFTSKTVFEQHENDVRAELGEKPEEGTVWGSIADLEANKLDAADQVVKSVSEDFTVTEAGELSINRTKVFVLDGGSAAGWPSPEEA